MTSHVAQTAHPVHDEDDRRRQIIEGLHYSRSFIISYNLVLVALLLCFAILYWATKALGRQRTRKYARKQEDDIRVDGGQRALATYSSSSSSSTLGEPAVPLERTKEGSRKDERTPLLAAADGRNTGPTHARASILHTFRSWMMYQPGNIPIVNKVLPSNATSLGILLFLGLNAFYMFYRVPLTLLTTFVFADRTGLLFVANLPLLYLFAAKNQPIVLLTGYSYETLNIFHRRLGELMALLALVHSAGMVTVWYTILYPRIDLWHFLAIKMIWLGLLAFTSYEVLYLTSLSSFRQRFYELFLGLHIILQAAALILVWFHHEGSRPYVGIALGIFLIDRLIFRLGLKTRTVKADLTVLEDGETVLLSSDWQLATPPPWRKYFNLHIKSGWGATEHVFLSVPALAHKHKIQAHPFTIASAAPAPSSQHAWLNFIIRAHDGFSRDLLHYAQSHPAVDVRIDGPYGSPHALEMLHASDVAVLVAGGSGIAVAYPLLWSLLVDADRDSTSANGRRIPRQVCLVWVVHDALHLDWVGQDRLNELRGRGLKVIIPPATRKAGRPDVGKLVDDAIASFGHLDKPAVGVVVSGPDGLNRDCRNACARLVGQGVDVHVSIEKFGW
ncbi:hypothetical protein MBLNU459_g2114t1 [Dothideomycetes sp. NU459]